MTKKPNISNFTPRVDRYSQLRKVKIIYSYRNKQYVPVLLIVAINQIGANQKYYSNHLFRKV